MLREALATFKALPAGRSAANRPRLAGPWPAPEVTATRGDQTAPRGLRRHHQGSRPARPSRRLEPQPPPAWAHRLPDSALLLAAPRRPEEPAQHHLLPAAALPPLHGDGGPGCDGGVGRGGERREGNGAARGCVALRPSSRLSAPPLGWPRRRRRPAPLLRPRSVRSLVAAVGIMVRLLNSIVAVSQNMGIGKDSTLPWPPLRYRGSAGLLPAGAVGARADYKSQHAARRAARRRAVRGRAVRAGSCSRGGRGSAGRESGRRGGWGGPWRGNGCRAPRPCPAVAARPRGAPGLGEACQQPLGRGYSLLGAKVLPSVMAPGRALSSLTSPSGGGICVMVFFSRLEKRNFFPEPRCNAFHVVLFCQERVQVLPENDEHDPRGRYRTPG